MLTTKGVFDGKTVKLLKPVPCPQKKEVIVTISDDAPQTQNELERKYTNYYKTLGHEEEAENSALEMDFSCV